MRKIKKNYCIKELKKTYVNKILKLETKVGVKFVVKIVKY